MCTVHLHVLIPISIQATSMQHSIKQLVLYALLTVVAALSPLMDAQNMQALCDWLLVHAAIFGAIAAISASRAYSIIESMTDRGCAQFAAQLQLALSADLYIAVSTSARSSSSVSRLLLLPVLYQSCIMTLVCASVAAVQPLRRNALCCIVTICERTDAVSNTTTQRLH
jgi:hypothetical protein